MTDDRDEIRDHFQETVNRTAAELQKWLDTDEPRSVGQQSGRCPLTNRGHDPLRTR